MAQRAVDAVLSSPDLVGLILERLPTPYFSREWSVRSRSYRCRPDRWAASQVNRVFRQAALGLPWKLLWTHFPGQAASSDDLACFTRFVESRNLQFLELHGQYADCAAALCSARKLETLRLGCKMEELSADWEQHSRLLAESAEGPSHSSSFTACLSLLSRLARLEVFNFDKGLKHASASWLLAAAPQLQHIKLSEWNGPPLGAGPQLKSLSVDHLCGPRNRLRGSLDEWAAPGLTALSLCFSGLLLGPSAEGPAAHSLQRLHLDQCCFELRGRGLRKLCPSLTHLFIGNFDEWWFTEGWDPKFPCLKGDHSKCVDGLFSEGLPVSLRELTVECLNNVGRVPRYIVQAVSGLAHLESLELRLICRDRDLERAMCRKFEPDPPKPTGLWSNNRLNTAFDVLMSLPSLRRACLELDAQDEDLLLERCLELGDLLKSRGGSFKLLSSEALGPPI